MLKCGFKWSTKRGTIHKNTKKIFRQSKQEKYFDFRKLSMVNGDSRRMTSKVH